VGARHQPDGQIGHQVLHSGTGEKVIDFTEDVAGITGNSTHLTLGKLLPLKNLTPGEYTLRLQVTDRNRRQTLTPSAQFTVI